MSYTVAEAASATGLSKTTILRAIEDGTIVGTRDEFGEWHIEPAELDLLTPSIAEPDGGDLPARYAAADVEAMSAQIEALLRKAGARLRQQLDDVRGERDGDHEHAAAEKLASADRHERRR